VKKLLNQQGTPRWIIWLIDFLLVHIGFGFAYQLRFNFSIPPAELENYISTLFYFSLVYIICFYFLKTYSGIIRHTGSEEIKRVIQTVSLASFLIFVSNWTFYFAINAKLPFPHSVILIQFFCNLVFLLAFRFFVRWLYQRITNPIKGRKNIIIYGAGESGLITKQTIERDAQSKMRVVAFLDDNKKLWGKKIGGAEILSPQKLEAISKKYNVSNLIISIQELKLSKLQNSIDEALELGIEVQNVPPVSKWIQGKLSANQIRNINIEDLLGRDSIQLDLERLHAFLHGKTILVTGAAGSIGSEICRQLLHLSVGKVVVLDQAESPIYELQQELKQWESKLEFVIADVGNEQRMRKVFRHFNPQLVFHSAAYKHVPLMENNPAEAIRVNVLGTKVVAELAHEFGIEKFVMVSTDKAVNPTNVMGATKKAAEILVQNLNDRSTTSYITTRFGNVLGSNGSVIPLFKKQIAKGGPITVTDPEITRYFMTIPEACKLVIEAGSIGKGGEIYVFDMGESIKIVDLAKKMVELSGLKLGTDIEIVFTGLREGEKLYEELLANKETTLETHHPKIMIGKVAKTELTGDLEGVFDRFWDYQQKQDNEGLVKLLKQLVPEFKSNNSVFQSLD